MGKERASVSLWSNIDKVKEVIEQFKKFGLFNVRIFGSVARGEDTVNSDIDLLCSLDRTKIPTEYLFIVPDQFARSIQKIVCRDVHVVDELALKFHLRETILKEAISL